MNVYLFRHGIALDIGENGISSDEDRELSKEGTDKTKKITSALTKIKCSPKRIISSPLTRARQTAQIAAEAFGLKVEVSEIMNVSSPVKTTIQWLCKQPDEDIMLTGHNPHMEILASCLISGDDMADIRLKKASICKISFNGKVNPEEGRLEFLMQPAQLLKLL